MQLHQPDPGQVALEQSLAEQRRGYLRRSWERSAKAGRLTETRPWAAVVRRLLVPMTEQIDEQRTPEMKAKPGPRAAYWAYTDTLTADVLAYLTLQTVIQATCGPRPITRLASVARRVGIAIEEEVKCVGLHGSKPMLMKIVEEATQKYGNQTQRVRAIRKITKQHFAAWGPWSVSTQLAVGHTFVNLLIDRTGLYRKYNSKTANRSIPMIQLSDAGLELVDQAHDWVMSTVAVACPLVAPPTPWNGMSGGILHDPDGPRLPLILSPNSQARLASHQGTDPGWVDEVNRVQNVPWRINRQVLEVLDWAVTNSLDIAGLPPLNDSPLPASDPERMDDEEYVTELRRSRGTVHRANRARQSKVTLLNACIYQAKLVADHPKIYFGIQADFRGRLYAYTTGPNPQGADFSKALCQFGIGKPLNTPEAEGWLRIHLANTYGVDKVPFNDRVAWTHKNINHILRSAAEPKTYQWWAEADEPFQCLAACFDLAGYITDPTNHLSYTPIAVDGSCNGLQHYSAMLRDPIGAEATNLTPGDAPRDIYADVAAAAQRILTEEADTNPVMALWAKQDIGRNMVKRAVMVRPYGGTRASTQAYLFEQCQEDPDVLAVWPERKVLFKAVITLTNVVTRALDEVVIASSEAMKWIQNACRLTLNAGGDASWITPSGFKVVPSYYHSAPVRYHCWIAGRTVKGASHAKDGKPNVRRAATAAAPNFVHSLDAAHLLDSAARFLYGHEDRCIGLIHDSYSTHAADMPDLARTLRECFYDLYAHTCPLAALKEEWESQVPGLELPPIPPYGDFEINNVLRSPYFFA